MPIHAPCAGTKSDEERFRLAAIVESSDDGIIGKTLEGVVTSWNEGARRIFGYSAEEIVGQPVALLVPLDRRNEEPAILARLARGERVEHFDTVRLCKSGKEIDVSVTISPVRDSAGALVGASKIVRDITQRRQAEQALAQATEMAKAASRELEAFSYSVAHDLRAPLRGMSGFAQVLLDTYRDKLDVDGKELLEDIVANARKMAALIDALLSLARLTKSELRHESVDLSALVHATAAQLREVEPDRAVELVVQDHLMVDLDLALARALIENLVGNAWKFTRNVQRPRVEFGVLQSHGESAFFVRDNGVGFDMVFSDKLFRPFQRLHTVNEFPGTGIGLATVQRIVHRHGGSVWAVGAVDAGATVFFSFPERTPGASR